MIRRSRARAFTLVEALAVTTLLGIVLPVVMYGISRATQTVGLIRDRNAASEVAANALTNLIANGNALNSGQTGVDDTNTYHWITNVQNPDVSTIANNANIVGPTYLHEVKIEVTWERRHQPQSLIVTTWLYDGGNGTAGQTGGLLP